MTLNYAPALWETCVLHSFRAATESALQNAISEFRTLLEPSSGWKPVSQPDLSTLQAKANKTKQFGNGLGQLSDINVHKKHLDSSPGPDVIRATADLAVTNDVDLRDFRAVLQNAEARVSCQSQSF